MADLKISSEVSIPLSEVDMEAVRAQGAGGQNVNKVSTAIHLRFDIDASSLPEHYKRRLKALSDRRISGEGVIVIKAQRFRSQDKNREDAERALCQIHGLAYGRTFHILRHLRCTFCDAGHSLGSAVSLQPTIMPKSFIASCVSGSVSRNSKKRCAPVTGRKMRLFARHARSMIAVVSTSSHIGR